MTRAAPILCLALLGACMTAPPPAEAEGRTLVVRAGDAETAAAVLAKGEASYAWVRSALPDTRDARAPVWVVERIEPFRGFPLNEATKGLRFDALWFDRIYLQVDAWEESLTHELVHFLTRRIWRRLPPFVEEGLCDWMTVNEPGNALEERRRALQYWGPMVLGAEVEVRIDESRPGGGRTWHSFRVSFRADLPEPEELARESALDLLSSELPVRSAAFAAGYAFVDAVVERHGLAGLHALCRGASSARQARIPLSELYRAAGVEDARGLGRRMLAQLDAEGLAQLCLSLKGPILPQLSRTSGHGPESEELARWLDEVVVEVRVPGSDVSVRLTSELIAAEEPEGSR